MDKPKCYLCGTEHKDYFKKHQLFDGRWVSVCSTCKISYNAIEEEAKRRGIISSNSRKGLQNEKGGENMADIQEAKKSEGIPYVGKKLYQENDVHEVKIISEFSMQDCDYQGKITKKPVGKVATKNLNVPKAIWEMNKATQTYFVKKYGTDSTKWITDEWIPIKLAAAGNANPSIYPEEVSLERVYI